MDERREFSVPAIFIGVIVNWFGRTAICFIFGMVGLVLVSSDGDVMGWAEPWMFQTSCVACLFLNNIFTGYLAASMAKGSKIPNATVVGVVVLIILMNPLKPRELVYEVMGIADRILLIPSIVFGAYLAARRGKKGGC